MHTAKAWIHAFLLTTTLLVLLAPKECHGWTAILNPENIRKPYVYPENLFNLQFDEILRLLDAIESGELEDQLSEEQLIELTHFIVFLAKLGMIPGDPDNEELLKDIEQLLEDIDPSINYEFDSGDRYS